MTQFIIHVGPHKTGTTYLQEAFALMRPLLAEHGIHYPTFWGGESHHELWHELTRIPNPALEAQFAGLRAAGHPTILLSAEALSVLPPPAAAYLRRLVGADTPVRIVFYIRPWVDLLPSEWKQSIKGGGIQTLPEFLFQRLANPTDPRYVDFHVNFGLKLRMLANAFGKEAISIVAYDAVTAAKRDLFNHFADTFLGLPDQPAPSIPPANVSPGTDQIEVIRALNVLERGRRGGPIPNPFLFAMIARYLKRQVPLATPALDAALAAHRTSLAVDETAGPLAALHGDVFAEFGACLVPPRPPVQFFRPRAAKIPFVHADYLLAADVQGELAELHRLICAGIEEPAAPAAPAPAMLSAPPGPAPAATRLRLDPYAAPEPAAPAAQVVAFRAGGNSDACVGDGWSVAERGGRWSAAPVCELLLSRPAEPGDYVLTIRARPFVASGQLDAQRLALEVNDVACGEVALGGPAVVRATLPWDVVGRAETLRLRFGFADAARPFDLLPNVRDQRLLGVSFERLSLAGPLPASEAWPEAEMPAAGAAPAGAEAPAELPVSADGALLLRFESLGENCEFGLVQRRCGVEPLGLLRFSSTPLRPLLEALRKRFEGFAEPGLLSVELGRQGREYMVHDRRFGFRYHAWVRVGELTPEQVLAREHRRLPLLVRKLVEDLTEARKIFVYRGGSAPGEAQIRTLLAAMRAYAGDVKLLWMDLADAEHPPGSVIALAPGLLKGHMDRFAPAENAHDLSLDCWLQVCRNAAALVS